jgi:hypothetical protein
LFSVISEDPESFFEKTLEGKASVSIVRTPVRGGPQKPRRTGFLEDQSGSQKKSRFGDFLRKSD